MAAATIAAATLITIASVRAAIGDSDLVGFHEAVTQWRQTGTYTQAFGAQFYLPAFIVLMAPIAVWPPAVAGAMMGLLNVLLTAGIARTLQRLSIRAGRPLTVRQQLWAGLLVLPFIIGTINLGQVNLLVIWLCLRSYEQVVEGRPWRGGSLIGLAAIVKVYPLIFTLYWLLKGRTSASAAGWLTAGLLAVGLSVPAFGFDQAVEAHRQWAASVRGEKYAASATQTQPAPIRLPGNLAFTPIVNHHVRHNNQSLAATLRRLTTDVTDGASPQFLQGLKMRDLALVHWPVWVSQSVYSAAAAILLALMCWIALRGRDTCDPLEYAAWLAAVIAFVPIWWTHYFVLFWPLLALSAGRSRMIVGLQIAWLAALPLLGWRAGCSVGVHCWMGMIILVWVLAATGWPAGGPAAANRPRSAGVQTIGS